MEILKDYKMYLNKYVQLSTTELDKRINSTGERLERFQKVDDEKSKKLFAEHNALLTIKTTKTLHNEGKSKRDVVDYIKRRFLVMSMC